MYRSRQLYRITSCHQLNSNQGRRNKNEVEDVYTYILSLILTKLKLKIIIIKKGVGPEREENIFISTFGRRFLPLFFKHETRACYLSYKIA